GGHGLGEIVEDERLLLHADIAGRIARCAANKRHVDLGGDVEQPLLSLDIMIFYNVFGGYVIDFGAAETRIDVSIEPHLGEQARLSAGAGGHDEGQIPGVARLYEALFQAHMERFRDAALDETAGGYDVIIPDEGDRLLQ